MLRKATKAKTTLFLATGCVIGFSICWILLSAVAPALRKDASDQSGSVAFGEGNKLSSKETALLKRILPHIKVVELPGGKGEPLKTVRFSGVNVQIVNGSGESSSKNGLGNLIVGYQELRSKKRIKLDKLRYSEKIKNDRTGSHNVVVGTRNNYSAFGGLVVGCENEISGEYASVGGGTRNIAEGVHSSVSGGYGNTASGPLSWASGGYYNFASGNASSVAGGEVNIARGNSSTITGGCSNSAEGKYSSVTGGKSNLSKGPWASVTGGFGNSAEGSFSWASGGYYNTASGGYSSVSGGRRNTAQADWSIVSGGENNKRVSDNQISPEEESQSSAPQ